MWVAVVLTIFDNWCATRKLHAYVLLYPAENVCMYVFEQTAQRCFCYCVQRAATTDNSGNTSYYYIR